MISLDATETQRQELVSRSDNPAPPGAIVARIGADRLTSPAAAAAFAKELQYGEFRLIAGARHHILMERDNVSAQFWALFDAFAAKI